MKRGSNESTECGEPGVAEPGEADMPPTPGRHTPELPPTAPPQLRADGTQAAAEDAGGHAATVGISKRTARAVGCGLSKRRLRAIEESKAFKVVTIFALVFALFGWTFVIILDVPDEPTNLIVDILMTLAFCVFVLELVMRLYIYRCKYPISFFFCMDLIGTASMVFEVTYILNEAGQIDTADSSVNAVLIRTTRAARLGARAGRLAKVLKCISLWTKARRSEDANRSEAQIIGHRIREILSAKVFLLTIVLVLGVPLFSFGTYPEEDLSMKAYSRHLEMSYADAFEWLTSNIADTNITTKFSEAVEDMLSFYSDLNYSPFRLKGYAAEITIASSGMEVLIPGDDLLSGVEPSRRQNIVRQQVKVCQLLRPGCTDREKAAIFFDFTEAKQYIALMDFAVVLFIIICMILESYDLSRTLDTMAIRPVDNLLSVVSRIAAGLRQVETEGRKDYADFEDTRSVIPRVNTTNGEMLEDAFRKLLELTSVFLQDSVVADEDLDDLHHESKGIIMEIMQLADERGPKLNRMVSRPSQRMIHSAGGVVAQLHIHPEGLDRWSLDVLGMQPEQRSKVVMHIMFASSIGVKTGQEWAEVDTFQRFLDSVRSGYFDNPYHNYSHAVDVVLSVYRLLNVLNWSKWLGEMETYALLVSALCHDLGHPGKTNPFLVETCHELSLRYNDKSPLENMHCSKLFILCKDASKNVFSLFEKTDYKRARSVCITAILATDNAKHFDMVKEVKKIYQINTDLCDAQMEDPENYADGYVMEVLRKDTMFWIKVMLHLADISNPLKPFGVYREWASRVLDEFFAQGDEEKRLGIPVGMLNDREKVSMPGSEHGFINFLVAPLLTSVVRIFPMIFPLAEQMTRNLEQWRDVWVEEADPSLDDRAKRESDILAVKESVMKLCPPTWSPRVIEQDGSSHHGGRSGSTAPRTSVSGGTEEVSPRELNTRKMLMRRISRNLP